MTIKDRITALCRQNNISVPEFERTVGLSKSAVNKWANAMPNVEGLLKVADYFNVSIDSLLGRSVSPSPSISPEARAVALAYDSADEDTRFVVRHSLGLTQKKHASLPG